MAIKNGDSPKAAAMMIHRPKGAGKYARAILNQAGPGPGNGVIHAIKTAEIIDELLDQKP